MEEQQFTQHIYSEEELTLQKKQKSRNRIFGIVLGVVILLAAITIAEIIILITK